MKKIGLTFIALGMGVLGTAAAASPVEALLKKASGSGVDGGNGYYYSCGDLRHIQTGALAGSGAAKHSVARKNPDPIPAIKAFQEELKKMNIELIVLPVPVKLAIYPPDGVDAAEIRRNHADFYAELSKAGVNVIDLAPIFLDNREKGVYCKTDSHWSPAGLELAARAVAARIKTEKWYAAANLAKPPFEAKMTKCVFKGDLLPEKSALRESVTLRQVDGVMSSASPILLIGDSHTLVFSGGGDMLAEKAGFAENLALECGLPVEVIGVRGSGATPVRINLYRKSVRNPNWLKHKKVVIWCFAAREFTQSPGGWAVVPVRRR